MIQKKNRTEQEQKQIAHGMCFGDRYNYKTGKTEICEHRDKCELYHCYKVELERREKDPAHFAIVDDYVGNQYIKDWRKCEVWKTHKHTKTDVGNE